MLIAIAPGIALAFAIYLNDRYDKEPAYLLVRVFLLGALIVVPTIVVEKLLNSINVFGGILWPIYTSFIMAGLTEEFFKRLVVLKVAYNNINFNEKLDGIVYSVFSALGFATMENISYVVFHYSNNPYVGIGRALFSVPAHMLFGVTMGYYLSLAKYCKDDEKMHKSYIRKSLWMPVVLHGMFDFILIANLPILMYFFVPYIIYLWITNLIKLNKYTKNSKDEFNRIDLINKRLD